jgi:hypothetical protein
MRVKDSVYVLQQGEVVHLPAIPPGKLKFSCAFSFDPQTFPPAEKLSGNIKHVAQAPLYDSILERVSRLAITVEQDEHTQQITLSFFVPCVFFNITDVPVTITESNARNPRSVTVPREGVACWCPASAFEETEARGVDLQIRDLTVPIPAFDWFTARVGQLYFRHLRNAKLCLGASFDISIRSSISCVTISPLIVFHNELDIAAILQPVAELPESYGKAAAESGLAALAHITGSPVVIPARGTTTIRDVTSICAFALTLEGFLSTPVLVLSREQQSVVKLNSPRGFTLAEMRVVDAGVRFEATLRRALFPTPIVIANDLDVPLSAYHMMPQFPFEIAARTTSFFAFDEPSGYPAVHLSFADARLHVSLIEDTAFIETPAAHRGDPVFVGISHTERGVRTVVVTTAPVRPPAGFSAKFTWDITAVTVSLLDMQTREFALLRLDGVKGSLAAQEARILFSAAIDAVQLDDQAPQAPAAVVFLGRPSCGIPFVKCQAIMPRDAPLFSTISYASASFQRMDIAIDASFLSDTYFLLAALAQPDRGEATARLPRPEKSETIVSVHWLEMSPIYAVFRFTRTSTRIQRSRERVRLLRFVPSIDGRLLLPGVVAARLSDSPGEIFGKIVAEYKTAALQQIITMLGSGGKLMSTLGVTGLIAQALDIKLTSELGTEISQFARAEHEEFDNRRELRGAFAEDSLRSIKASLGKQGMTESDLINGLLANADVGLKLIASGQGLFGLLSKSTVDAMSNLQIMDASTRKRVPRAFLKNRIEKYEATISMVQVIIQKVKPAETIRITAKAGRHTACCTEHYVFVLNEELTAVAFMLAIGDGDVSVCGVAIEVRPRSRTSDAIVLTCSGLEEREEIKTYLASQATMIRMFRTSLI